MSRSRRPQKSAGMSRTVNKSTLKRKYADISDLNGGSSVTRRVTTKSLNRTQLLQQREKLQQMVEESTRALGTKGRDSLNQQGSSNHPHDGSSFDFEDNDAEWMDIDSPAGASGSQNTERDAWARALRDLKLLKMWKGLRSRRGNNWRERRTAEFKTWDTIIDSMVDAYISWKYSRNDNIANDSIAAPASSESTTAYTVAVYDLFTCEEQKTVHRPPDSLYPAIDFAHHGVLTRSPLSPSVAISFRTLEHYHQLRCRKPSFSAEAFAKVLCDSYKIPYQRYLSATVADTYEIFLTIIRQVEKRIHAALGWDTPEWRALNACSACCYKLEDEPELRFSRLWAFDGNDSLKRIATHPDRTAADTRIFSDSDYFLPHDYVNKYAHEVKSRRSGAKGPQIDPLIEDESDPEPIDDVEGDPTDGFPVDKGVDQCVKNWKAAASDDKKKAWGIFDETGIFASACRHSLILWLADMVQSGELAKYPLAIVSKANDNFDPAYLIGFDIGCAFWSTVENSSLGGRFKQQGHMLCVNAFHGYTHSYQCQVKHHPNVIEGIGLEDLETLERIFSSSNQLASTIRYASPYRRRQLIHAYFRQWDEDKYANLGTFLLNNYKQALDVLERDGEALELACKQLDVTEEQLDTWAQEEQQYFSTLGQEKPWDIYAVAYVELLQRLEQLSSERKIHTSRFYSNIPSDYTFASPANPVPESYSEDVLATARLERRRRKALEEYDRVHNEVIDLEIRMNISPSERWTPASPQYIETVKYLAEREFHRALNKVQKLVIQRLFELHKLNLAQTGYKLRTHLAKSLQTRCKTIKKAVADYNKAAAKLSPPREPLDWTEVSHYGFLERFVVLQDTQNSLRDRRWAEDGVREAIKLRRHITRAKEEIERCNVEVRRLHTAIADEAVFFRLIIDDLEKEASPMLGPVRDFVLRRTRVNEQLLSRVHEIYALPGFTGKKTRGLRVGKRPLPLNIADPSSVVDVGNLDLSEFLPLPQSWLGKVPGVSVKEDGDDEEELDVEEDEDIGGIVQYMGALSTK